jgi:hypothetical protein
MNEINYITLKRHGWTDKLIEKFNLHPTSYNIKSHKSKFDNSVVMKIESSQEFRDELIKIQKEKNLKKTVSQLKKQFLKHLNQELQLKKLILLLALNN